jgi:isocitrate dehydrogenase
MSERVPITVAYGDGIGPEIMEATLRILDSAQAKIQPEVIEIGEKVYERGVSAGIEEGSWESLRRTKVFLKAPITTPQGGGFKSLNVTVRKTLGLFANVRPCTSYSPFVATRHPGMDVVIVRENEEDLYAGIEHRQTDEVYQCIKIVSQPGSEKIIRYAFEYAKQNGRRKVSCFTKDNIMKLSDGLFHRLFDEIGAEYPDIEKDHWIIDIGAARLADTPNIFDVIVTLNLYGDIISDIAAQITGSVGLGGSANIGGACAMFEAIHGSAPPLAGKNVANPSGLLLGAVMMLVHIGQPEEAEAVHNAWLKTLEDGVHTQDIFNQGVSSKLVGTKEFADAVIARLGQRPTTLKPVDYDKSSRSALTLPPLKPRPRAVKETVGIDVFLHWAGGCAEEIADKVHALGGDDFDLIMITNRGVKVWPGGVPETGCADHWRCRFMAKSGKTDHARIVGLLGRIGAAGIDFIKTEHLCTFDGQPGYSLGQGQ